MIGGFGLSLDPGADTWLSSALLAAGVLSVCLFFVSKAVKGARGGRLWSGGFALIFLALMIYPNAGEMSANSALLALSVEVAGYLLIFLGHLRFLDLPSRPAMIGVLGLAALLPLISARVFVPDQIGFIGALAIGLLSMSGGLMLMSHRSTHGYSGLFLAGFAFMMTGCLRAIGPGLESGFPQLAAYSFNLAPAMQFAAGIGLIMMNMQALISERGALIRTLDRHASTLNTIFNSIAQGIVVTDEKNGVIGINEHALTLLGSPQIAIGDRPDFKDLMEDWAKRNGYDGASLASLWTPAEEAAEHEQDVLSLELPQLDGGMIEIRRDRRDAGGYVHSFSDITERKRVEDRLREMASTDSLTGLNNRRRFMELAEAEISRCRRFERPMSVMMIDIDHFKKINDNYGHLMGDRVIRTLGHVLTQSLRNIDIAGRVGGEEYAVLLPETEIEPARQVAERLRESIKALSIPGQQGEIKITVSIGLTELEETDDSLESLLGRADQALYVAKRQGRDQVFVSESEAA